MKAICIELVDDKPELFLRDVPKPTPGPQEVLVRVCAAGVNFADLARASKHFENSELSAAAIAGLEMAGEVVEVGSAVKGVAVGDRVSALAAATYAEYCRVDHRLLMPVPASMSWIEGAALSAAFITAHDALITNGEMTAGETVLVQAASSSVGIAAIQLARHFGAGLVLGTSGSGPKLEKLMSLGMHHGINSKEQDFAQAVLKATSGRGADVIIENIGGDTLPGDITCAAVKCRIVNVGRLGRGTGQIDLEEHSRKRIKVIGVSYRTRSVEEHAEVVCRAAAAMLPAFGTGKLRPVIDRAFPLDQASQAQDYLKSGRHFGKVVLSIE